MARLPIPELRHGATPWEKDMINNFSSYRKSRTTEMRPWVEGEDMTGVSISKVDRENGSPKAGDMIARNPGQVEDMWLVSAAYFATNYKPEPS